MTQSAVRFDRVRKNYGRQAVLQGIDLEIAAGMTFGLVGINGAGKTTLIKCLLDFSIWTRRRWTSRCARIRRA